jgi:hypothetical protein
MKPETNIFVKFPFIKFYENLLEGSTVVCTKTDGRLHAEI